MLEVVGLVVIVVVVVDPVMIKVKKIKLKG